MAEAFFVDHAGRTWLVYHAWTAPLATNAAGGVRSLRIDPVALGAGTLTIDGPSASLRTIE